MAFTNPPAFSPLIAFASFTDSLTAAE